MSAASHTNYISHTPERDSSSGNGSDAAPSLLARVGSAAQSVLQTLSFGAASSLLPTLNGPSGGGRRTFGGSLQEGSYSSARSHFTGLGRGRRKRTAGALLGHAIDNDPLVIAEDEAFHRRVVQVLLLVGVLMLLFVGSTAIITLDAPRDLVALPSDTALQPHDMRLAQLDSAHEQQEQHEQQQEHEQHESVAAAAAVPVASEPAASYAEHEQQQQLENGSPDMPVAPFPRSTVPDPSEATSAEDEALAAEAQRHVSEQEALARSDTMLGHDQLRREADRLHEEEFQRQQLRLMKLRQEQERLRAEEEAAAAAQSEQQQQGQRRAAPPRRYGPLCTHVLARHTELFGSLDARAPALAQLAQRSAVALAGPARRIRDRLHSGGNPRQRVLFQPRDLRTPLGGRALAEQIGTLRAALATEQGSSADRAAAAAVTSAAAAAAGDSGDADSDLVGEGYVDAQVLEALPESEWRRFALPESPPYDEDSGEPLAWDAASDHGEVWVVGASGAAGSQ